MVRKLRASDFKNEMFPTVRALYNGNSRYLTAGEYYNVTINSDRTKATVQLGFNPQMQHSNSGVQFSLGSFLVEEEEGMVNFADLTPEDQERIMNQAKQMVEDETIRKNAVAMYAIKKKEYLEDMRDEVLHAIGLDDRRYLGKDKDAMINKIKTLIYALYRHKKYGYIPSHMNQSSAIETQDDWNMFVSVGNRIKLAVINSVNPCPDRISVQNARILYDRIDYLLGLGGIDPNSHVAEELRNLKFQVECMEKGEI